MAFHGKTDDGTNVVDIGNLRVVIIQEEKGWFARGLEIDYAAQASSLAGVKKAFEQGLYATVHENLRVYGSIRKLLKPAPPEVWTEMLFGATLAGKHFKRYSQISMHSRLQQALPFKAIDYLELPKAA
ncbi:MAG: hypothetical protein DMG44_10645 [Acidobacteria bacterium]|nr:MAG: hypothetical protein DMG44_10645 [Acidobacteriota bacterium]